jgi:hypothetical protein
LVIAEFSFTDVARAVAISLAIGALSLSLSLAALRRRLAGA